MINSNINGFAEEEENIQSSKNNRVTNGTNGFMRKYLRVFYALLIGVLATLGVAVWEGLCSFLFAWTFNFMLMMVVLSINKAIMPEFSSSYYISRKWEKEGKIYKWLGINGFRKLLVWVGWEKLNKAANPVKKDLAALRHLEYTTRQSESGHLVIFFIVLAFSLFIIFNYGLRQSVWLLFLNVLLHAYPIGVQRYNRPRFQKAINKLTGSISK